MTDTHVVPLNDLRDHRYAIDCWCQPVRDGEYPSVIIHNSMDERETYETGRKLQ